MSKRDAEPESQRPAVQEFEEAHREGLISLWERCGLTRPWNDPARDIDGFVACPTAAILVVADGASVLASVCVGHDGHRGWYYYLATAPEHRGQGLARLLMRNAEDWLRERNIGKAQLMVRADNLAAKAFYARVGYQPNPCHLMQRWLEPSPTAPRLPLERDDGRLETVVTFLEMTAHPDLRPVHPPPNLRLALLRALEPTVAFYRFLYDSVGAPWLWWERRLLDDQALSAIIHAEDVEIYVLYAEGAPVGYFELDRRPAPDIELAYFGLVPEAIGRGLGRYLLYNAIETAWNHEPERLLVNTNTLDHPGALPLYQRMGFRPYRRETKVIIDPRATGVIPLSP